MLRGPGSFALCILLLHLVYSESFTSDDACPAPAAPENSIAVGNNTVGSTVTFLCKEGFFRLGEPFRVTCQTDRRWTNSNVSCVARSCGDPGSPLNGKRIGWLFQYGNNVTYKCNPGYVLRGSKTLTCLSNQTWSGAQPICKPISCGEPPIVTDAEIFSGGHVYGAHVHYTCHEGFQGSGTLECGAQGKWLGKTPLCKAVICADPGVPLHGSRVGSEMFKYGTKIQFQCDKGYILFGSHDRTCNREGEWTGVQPYCVECAKVDTPVLIRKGVRFLSGLIKEKRGNIVKVLTSLNEEEDVIILGRGTQHYAIVKDKVPAAKDIFNGSRILAKARNGKYTFATVNTFHLGKYEVTFEERKKSTKTVAIDSIRTLDPPRFCATCPDPGRPKLSNREDDLEEFIPGMEVEYGCEINTNMTGSRKRTCLPSGEWTGMQPKCTISACSDLDVQPPAHGERSGDYFLIGSRVNFLCAEGYELVGESALTCRPDGQWSGDAPICKDLCDSVSCEPWEKCVYDVTTGPRCVCREALDCPADFQPVCASDANRYNNDCIMKAKACREGGTLEKVADGSCSPGAICQINPTSKCRGYFPNFYYSQKTKRCESIIAGGCHPSGWNGFTSMEDCNRTCLVDVCSQPTDPGPCKTKVNRWAFNPKVKRCKRFEYGGCFGNENNFQSKEQCNKRCQSEEKRSEDLCPPCIQTKIREACKESTFAAIGKVRRKIPEDTVKKHVRYMVKIEHVLKNSTGSIPAGNAVLSVPYNDSPDCPCPSLPLDKFILMGHVIIEPAEQNPKLGLVITQPAYVQKWSDESLHKLKKKCPGTLNYKGMN